MQYSESLENYLETIYRLALKRPEVRAVDVAAALSFSRPSVSRAIHSLQALGDLEMGNEDASLRLTESGRKKAENVYARHRVLTKAFVSLGVNEIVAEEDACKIEHVISEETFTAIKAHLAKE